MSNSVPAKSQTHSQHKLSPVIDGRTNPELIPDDLAYHHFLLAISEHRNISELEAKRREAFLRPVGLSREDQARVISALAGVREDLDAVTEKRWRLMAGTDPDRDTLLMGLKAEENTILQNARDRLNLSNDGQALLDKYVRTRVKSHIVVMQ